MDVVPPDEEKGLLYRHRVLIFGFITTIFALAAGAQTVTVSHEAPRCLPDRCVSPKLIAKITSPERVDTVTVYFRGQAEGDRYFTMMRPSNESGEMYWGYLPVAKDDDIDFVEYYVEATDWSGVKSRSDVYKVEVSNGCEVEELTEEEKRIARNLVVGLTKSGQYPVPPGFRCAGIVASVTASGDLMPNEECRKQRADDGDDSLCPIIWLKPTGIVVGVAAAAVIVADDEPEEPLSRSRP